MVLRAPALAVLMTAAMSFAATAQALRPSLSAAMPSPKEQVTVSISGFAGISAVASSAVAPAWTNKFRAGRRADYEAIVTSLAKANEVPEELVHRVIVRESKYQANLIGTGGCIGMMQIKLATARGMGYTGDTEGLLDAQTNLRWGIKYLAGAWRAAQGNADLAVRKYAAGYYVRRARTAASR